jgi:hypothetical protein
MEHQSIKKIHLNINNNYINKNKHVCDKQNQLGYNIISNTSWLSLDRSVYIHIYTL